ncbi:MAG: alpha/beta hydrolase [Ornithinibacter sp.]
MTPRVTALMAALVLVLAGCGAESVSSGAGATKPARADGSLTWGDGGYGVVLAHGAAFDAASWQEQAKAIAAQGATVVAVEDISTDGIRAAVDSLHDGGIKDVALVGGSAGADAILQLAAEQPDLADQLVLISPNTVVKGLGTEPKLFIASEGEPGADIPRQLLEVSTGPDNRMSLLPGDAHAQNIFDTDQARPLLDMILKRLAT